MSTKPDTADYILEQLSEAGEVSVRKMFGEYGLYCDGKFAGVICDDELFLKPTEEGRAFAPGLGEGSPYPGAKPHLHVTGDRLEDAEWVAELLCITSAALPLPKPKKPKKKKA